MRAVPVACTRKSSSDFSSAGFPENAGSSQVIQSDRSPVSPSGMRLRREPSTPLTVAKTSRALRSGTLPTRWTWRMRSVEMKLAELAVLSQDTPYRTRHRTHHDGLGFDHILAEFDATKHRPGCDACRGEETIAPHHVFDLVFFLRILDAHLRCSRAQFLGVDDQPCLHLPANAAQSSSREHALRRAANAKINVDTGFRIRPVNHAGDIPVADQANCGARLSHGGNDIGVTRAVEQ